MGDSVIGDICLLEFYGTKSFRWRIRPSACSDPPICRVGHIWLHEQIIEAQIRKAAGDDGQD